MRNRRLRRGRQRAYGTRAFEEGSSVDAFQLTGRFNALSIDESEDEESS